MSWWSPPGWTTFPRPQQRPNAAVVPWSPFALAGYPTLLITKKTGYLAKPFETDDLAKGIQWVLEEPKRHADLSSESRARALREWDTTKIVQSYMGAYQAAIDTFRA